MYIFFHILTNSKSKILLFCVLEESKIARFDRFYKEVGGFTNYFFVQKRCVLVYSEGMTHLEKKQERKKKKNNKRIKKKIDPYWDKKKNDDKPWCSDFLFWDN